MTYLIDINVLVRLANLTDAQHAIAAHSGLVVVDPATV
jgi:hypothetical protein